MLVSSPDEEALEDDFAISLTRTVLGNSD
jgi:hypothetical protein